MRGIGRPAGRITATTIAALCALLLLATGAQAAPPWAAAVTLAPPVPGFGGAPSIAVARDGTRYVGYARSDGANALATVYRAAPGGGYEAGVVLSAPGVTASVPEVAVDRQGTATAVWQRGTSVQTATRPAGGAWGAPQTLGATSGTMPSIAAGDNGAAVVAWAATTGGQSRIATALRPAGVAAFEAPTMVSAASGTIYLNPRVAMDAAGDVAVLWQRRYEVVPGTFRYVMESALKPATSGFATPESRSSTGGVASAGANTSIFDVVMTSAGRILASWDYYDGTTSLVQYAERVPGATFGGSASWSARKDLSDSGTTSSSMPRIAVNDAGAAVAVWYSANAVISAVRPTADGAFSAPKPLSGAGADASTAAVDLSASGEAEAAWTVSSGNDRAVVASRRAPGEAAFGDPVDATRTTIAPPVTAIGYSPLAVGLDDQGNGAVAWQQFRNEGSGTTYAPVTSDVDPVAPELGGVSVPASAAVGAPTAFAATATDRSSTPTITWSFGDGGTATGPNPTHAFGAPGAYTVTVTATDAIGNASTTTRPLLVTAAAGGGGAGGGGGTPGTTDVDADGDGVVARLDCNDKNAAIRPGATEIRGNAVDEDCSGKADRLLPIAATAKLSSKRLSGGRTRTSKLTVSGLKKGDVVALSCKGGGCRKAATTRRTIKKGTSLSLTSAVRGMTLRSGATLVVKVTRKGFSTRVVTFRTAKKAAPARTLRCQDPGASATRVC